jgi:hypothetical protein
MKQDVVWTLLWKKPHLRFGADWRRDIRRMCADQPGGDAKLLRSLRTRS